MDEQEPTRPRSGAPSREVADRARGADSPDGHDAHGPETSAAAGPAEDPAQPEAPAEQADAGQADADEAEGPRPLGVGVVPTGHEPVDAQLHRLQDADHLEVSAHLEVYEDVHRGLRDTLTALDRHEQ